eukprot:10017144-Heterocapsa_arctica.AAC.1
MSSYTPRLVALGPDRYSANCAGLKIGLQIRSPTASAAGWAPAKHGRSRLKGRPSRRCCPCSRAPLFRTPRR